MITITWFAQHHSPQCTRDEEVFDKDVVFGRDTGSVFPSESRKVDPSVLEAVVGSGNRFISATELAELKAKREAGGGATGDGIDPETGEPYKPLLQVLRENKDSKDKEWEERIKIIKQGEEWTPLERRNRAWVGFWEHEFLNNNNIKNEKLSNARHFQKKKKRQEPAVG